MTMADIIFEESGAPGTGRRIPILEARHLTKHFPARGGKKRGDAKGPKVVHAADDVSLSLYSGQITALVGESGSGKSTLARLLSQLYHLTSGEILFKGKPVKVRGGRAFREYVSDVQLILQDPFGSFNPLLTIRQHLERAAKIHHPDKKGKDRTELIYDLLSQVNLNPPQQFADKFPHELSGGQLQRCSIARALAANPAVFLADEPVSSLDVSIRLGILNLLRRLTEERNVGLLYVTHDIASARYFAAETAVMYAGEIIESGPSEEVTQKAAHPYTQLLIASAPDPGRDPAAERVTDIGQPPSLIDPPTGCRFHPRCPQAMERCTTQVPPKFDLGNDHWAKCWLYADDVESPGSAAQAQVTAKRPSSITNGQAITNGTAITDRKAVAGGKGDLFASAS
jgi:peptide/nickel transport system ATP-binding protein